tara:strand:- start:5062 stop:5496 length:435 start_codon:yes stop_codon:yes gene_type:complete
MLLKTALMCMAMNVYHEARSEPIVGQIAVAQVVINRVNDKRFPNTICGVVKQAVLDDNGLPKKNMCHFSWYCDGADDTPNTKSKSWKTSMMVAKTVISGKTEELVGNATHYHAISVMPYWAKNKKYRRIAKIDKHIFYRWENRK